MERRALHSRSRWIWTQGRRLSISRTSSEKRPPRPRIEAHCLPSCRRATFRSITAFSSDHTCSARASTIDERIPREREGAHTINVWILCACEAKCRWPFFAGPRARSSAVFSLEHRRRAVAGDGRAARSGPPLSPSMLHGCTSRTLIMITKNRYDLNKGKVMRPRALREAVPSS